MTISHALYWPPLLTHTRKQGEAAQHVLHLCDAVQDVVQFVGDEAYEAGVSVVVASEAVVVTLGPVS